MIANRCHALAVLGVLCLVNGQLPAQGIEGTVADSTGRPLPGADVVIDTRSDLRTRTDDQGRFFLVGPLGGSHVLRVRLIGYRPYEHTVRASFGGRTRIRVVLVGMPQLLSKVRIMDQNACAPTSLDGFECRRAAGVGYFRDAGELRALKPSNWADMLDGMPGVRRAAKIGPYGVDWRVAAPPGRCLVELWNGQRAMELAGDAPFQPDEYWKPVDVIAIEYYDEYRKVPARFQGLAWPPKSERCALVIYWLRGAQAWER